MRRQVLSLALIFALAVTAFAQQKSASEALPSVERLREHITYLASDDLEGRRTGTGGDLQAGIYIAKEFYDLGLDCRESWMCHHTSNNHIGYMQEFPFVAGIELGKNNSMFFTPVAVPPAQQGKTPARQPTMQAASLDLRLGEDWMPLGFSSNAQLKALPATFVGYGIKAAELNYDDYSGGQEVTNRIAIALAGTPDGDSPHGQFMRYADVRWKAIAARNSGAAALIVIAREENFKDDRLARLSYDNGAGDADLPVVVISRQAARRILEAGGLPPLAELEKAASASRSQATIQTKAAGGETRKGITMALKDAALSISTHVVRRNAAAFNVVGILEGSDPELKKEAIVIGAHYDHLGRGGAGSLAQRQGDVHHGADDNASGVAGVLELARIFSSSPKRPRRTLVFIAFSGEEEGLLGSNFYVNNPVWPLNQTVAMINMDMIGRMKDNRLMIGGVGTSSEWRDWIQASQNHLSAPQPTGVDKGKGGARPGGPAQPFTLTLNEDGYGPSDHSSFYAKQIPVLFFFTGTHDDYHKPTDTAEKINYRDEARILSFIKSLIRSIDEGSKRPTYAVARSQAQGRSMGFRVFLGTIPNYAESNDGLKLDGVREDSPAAKAGLKAGDRIVKMAGRDVRNVYDYTYALGEMKAGQEYEVEIVRGTETLKLKITPTARNQ